MMQSLRVSLSSLGMGTDMGMGMGMAGGQGWTGMGIAGMEWDGLSLEEGLGEVIPGESCIPRDSLNRV